MFARVTTIQGRPGAVDDAIRVIENDVIPAAKMLDGFRNGYWLADRKTGTLLSVTIFETEADLQLSELAAAKLRSASTEKLGTDILDVSRYEVVARV